MDTTAAGREGEDKAAEYIMNSGYRILERNFRGNGGEIDIIAEREDEIVFFEVKTWRDFDEMELERMVNARKRDRIIRAARAFLAGHGMVDGHRVRFDILLLERGTDRVKHYEDAFTESGVT